MKKTNINMAMVIMVGVAILLLSSIFKEKNIRLHPNCEIQPNNPDCQCYDGKVKIQKTVQCVTEPCQSLYECIYPQCNQETVNTDCKDRLHILCVGKWNCIQNQCNWVCT